MRDREVRSRLVRIDSVKLLPAEDVCLGLVRVEQPAALDVGVLGAIHSIKEGEQGSDARATSDQANLGLAHRLLVCDLEYGVTLVGQAADRTFHKNGVSDLLGHQVGAHLTSVGELLRLWVALDHKIDASFLVQR